MMKYNSEISGFYKLSMKERRSILAKLTNLDNNDIELLASLGYLTPTQIDTLVENVVGSYNLPLGVALNFKVNEKDYIFIIILHKCG